MTTHDTPKAALAAAIEDHFAMVEIARTALTTNLPADMDRRALLALGDALQAAIGGFLWLGNNLDNAGRDPLRFREFFDAALTDARKAYDAWKAAFPECPGHPDLVPGTTVRSEYTPFANDCGDDEP
jgi:hypothetical protein